MLTDPDYEIAKLGECSFPQEPVDLLCQKICRMVAQDNSGHFSSYRGYLLHSICPDQDPYAQIRLDSSPHAPRFSIPFRRNFALSLRAEVFHEQLQKVLNDHQIQLSPFSLMFAAAPREDCTLDYTYEIGAFLLSDARINPFVLAPQHTYPLPCTYSLRWEADGRRFYSVTACGKTQYDGPYSLNQNGIFLCAAFSRICSC